MNSTFLATAFNTHGAAVTVVMYTNVSVGHSICSTCNIPLQLMHITTTVTISILLLLLGIYRSSSEAGMLIFLPRLATIMTCADFNNESLSPVTLLAHSISRHPT